MPGLGTKITKFTSVIVVNLKYLYRDTVLFSDCFGYKSIFSHCLHTFVPPFLLSSGIFCLFSVCIGFLPLELTRFPLFWKTLPLVGSKASLSCQICRLYGSHTYLYLLFVCLFVSHSRNLLFLPQSSIAFSWLSFSLTSLQDFAVEQWPLEILPHCPHSSYLSDCTFSFFKLFSQHLNVVLLPAFSPLIFLLQSLPPTISLWDCCSENVLPNQRSRTQPSC